MLPVTFPGLDLTDTKEIKPITRIFYTATPYTVKSFGLNFYDYAWDIPVPTTVLPDFESLSNLTLLNSGVIPIVAFYAANGAPLGISIVDYFARRYYGYFYAEFAGTYRFDLKGFGKGTLSIDGNPVYDPDGVDLSGVGVSGFFNNTTAGSWHTIDIRYWVALGETGFVALYTDPVNNKSLPISAGITSLSPSYISTTEVQNVYTDVSINLNQNDISTLSFSVPLVPEISEEEGYYKNSDGDFVHSSGALSIRRYSMVEAYVGYVLSNGTEKLVRKFVGHIISPSINRKENKITFLCKDFKSLLKTSLNLNYPDKLDYWISGYAGFESSDTNPDGIDMPTTFDGWELTKAFQVLLIRGGIDPYLFLRKREFLDSGDATVVGGFLIEEANPAIYFEKSALYGNPQANAESSQKDDEYLLKSNFGDYIFDYITKLLESYAWYWDIDPFYNGSPVLTTRNNPTSIYIIDKLRPDTEPFVNPNVHMIQTSNFKKNDIDAIGGIYYESNSDDAGVYGYFYGERLNFVVGLNHDTTYVATILNVISQSQIKVSTSDLSKFSVNQVWVFYSSSSDGSPEAVSISSIDSINNIITFADDVASAIESGMILRRATYVVGIWKGETIQSSTFVGEVYHSCAYSSAFQNYDSFSNSNNRFSNSQISDRRFYYEGIDPDLSVNPTVHTIIKNIKRDKHWFVATRLPSTSSPNVITAGVNNAFIFNAALVYDTDRDTPKATYYSNKTITELEIDDNFEELRNDVIVVGRRLGADVAGGEQSRVINPNNPTFRHVLSRSIDRASIFDPNSVNFAGRNLSTILIDPSISEQSRADFWSFSFLNRYRNPKSTTRHAIIRDPRLEIFDCIRVIDSYTNAIRTTKLWITSLDMNIQNSQDSIDTSGYRLWESYTVKPPVDPTGFSNLGYGSNPVVINVELENNGTADAPFNAYHQDLPDTPIGPIQIKFDLVQSGYVRIDIYHDQGSDGSSFEPNMLVATLLNTTDSSSLNGWSRFISGKNYRVTWDTVNNQLDGRYNISVNAVNRDASRFGGYYSNTRNDLNYEKFYYVITVRNTYTNKVIGEFNSRNHPNADKRFIYLQLYPSTELGNLVYASVEPAPSLYFIHQWDDLTRGTIVLKPFYNDTTLDASEENGGLKISVATQVLNRPCQLYIKADARTYWEVNRNKRGIVAHDPKSILETNEFINYNTSTRHINFLPERFGWSYNNWIALISDKTIVDDVLIRNKLLEIGWLIKIDVELIDKAGKFSRQVFYHRWIGTNKSEDNRYELQINRRDAVGYVLTGGQFALSGDETNPKQPLHLIAADNNILLFSVNPFYVNGVLQPPLDNV